MQSYEQDDSFILSLPSSAQLSDQGDIQGG